MGLFLPEGFCNLHFVSRITGGPEVTFAIAYDLLDSTPVDVPGAYDDFVTFGSAIGWSGEVSFVAVRAETGTATPGEPIVTEFAGTETGAGLGEMSPPMVSFLVKKQTALGGRKNRGRAFVPHVLESVTFDNGSVNLGFVEAAQEAFTDFSTAVAGHIEAETGVLLHTDPDDAPTPLTSAVWESKVATQRRRFDR